MDEAIWLNSIEPAAMLTWLTGRNAARQAVAGVYPVTFRMPTLRKFRLFVEVATGISAWANMDDFDDWVGFAHAVVGQHPEKATASLVRHIFGSPFRPGVTRPCKACGGSKRVKKRVRFRGNAYDDSDCMMADCTACKGRGWEPVPPPQESVDCETCRGHGKRLHCRYCRGSYVAPESGGNECVVCSYKLGETILGELRPCEPCKGVGSIRVPYWPAPVLALAEVVYQQEAAAVPMLVDTLEEVGQSVLAKHFREEGPCPRGCWAIDYLTGKE